MAICFFSFGYSQDFKPYEIKRLNALGLNTQIGKEISDTYVDDFSSILKHERKRKVNKTVGIILTSIGVLTTSVGIKILSGKPENDEARPFQDVFGGLFTGAGNMYGNFSSTI